MEKERGFLRRAPVATRYAPAIIIALVAACSPDVESQPAQVTEEARPALPPPAVTPPSGASKAEEIARLISGKGSLPRVIQRFGEPKESRPAGDQPAGATDPVLQYHWGYDVSVVPGSLMAFAQGDSVHRLMLAPDDNDPESVAAALGVPLHPVHFAFCAAGTGDYSNQETYLVSAPDDAGAATQLKDDSGLISLEIDSRGKVSTIIWGILYRHHSSRAGCPN
jgi:hypothetical protein